MGKRILCIPLLGVLLFGLCSCGNRGTIIKEPIQTVVNPTESNLYQDIYDNENIMDHIGKTMTKTGVFTKVEDEFNFTTRYYIWGYSDETQTIDWQWEFSYENMEDMLLRPGSIIEITGVFKENTEALDGYRFEDVSIKVIERYEHTTQCDVDMSTMSATLQRIQMTNILFYPNVFNQKKICLYGRVISQNTIQDPYHNDGWTLQFSSSEKIELPPTGSVIVMKGVLRDGILDVTDLETMN